MASKLCATCGEPGTIFCKDCDGYGEPVNGKPVREQHWYCGQTCSDKDHGRHQEECTARADAHTMIEVRRAGELASSLFYRFLEKTWSFDIQTPLVERHENGEPIEIDIIAGAGSGPGVAKSDCERQGGGWLFKFPVQQFEWAKDEITEDRKAVLADGRSFWAFIVMHTAVRLLFEKYVENIDEDIKEVTHTLPPEIERLVTYCTDMGERIRRNDLPYAEVGETAVCEITLKSGQRIALDLAGRQYKTPHSVIREWNDYRKTYGGRLLQRNAFGTAVRIHEKLRDGFSKRGKRSKLDVDAYLLNEFSEWLTIGPQKVDKKELSTLPSLIIPKVFQNSKGKIEKGVSAHLDKILAQIEKGFAEDPKNKDCCAGLRHHDLLMKQRHRTWTFGGRDMIMPDIGSLKYFNWDILRSILEDPRRDREWWDGTRDEACQLLAAYNISKPYGDWKLQVITEGQQYPVVHNGQVVATGLTVTKANFRALFYEAMLDQDLMSEEDHLVINPKVRPYNERKGRGETWDKKKC